MEPLRTGYTPTVDLVYTAEVCFYSTGNAELAMVTALFTESERTEKNDSRPYILAKRRKQDEKYEDSSWISSVDTVIYYSTNPWASEECLEDDISCKKCDL